MMKTLRLLILLMCHHQDCQRRVQQEIDDVIGQLDKPTANHRKDMPYTEAVIMEMMRYVSQTPIAIPHKCNKDVILDGYLIEKDTGVSIIYMYTSTSISMIKDNCMMSVKYSKTRRNPASRLYNIFMLSLTKHGIAIARKR